MALPTQVLEEHGAPMIKVWRRTPTVLLAIGLLAIGLLAIGCGDDDATPSPTSEPAPTSTSAPPSTTNSSTVAPPPSTPGGTTSTIAQGTAPASAPTPEARPGGGSGEVAVRWDAVAGATGYRVQRASGPDGPFEVSADIDVETGRATLSDGVTNLWSPAPGEFEYIELIRDGSVARYFRVVGYNDAGEGPASGVICGAPSGTTGC